MEIVCSRVLLGKPRPLLRFFEPPLQCEDIRKLARCAGEAAELVRSLELADDLSQDPLGNRQLARKGLDLAQDGRTECRGCGALPRSCSVAPAECTSSRAR